MYLLDHAISSFVLGILLHSPEFILGALIPDIIDKTVGYIFVGTGRAFMHTAVLILIFSTITLCAYVKRKWFAPHMAFFTGGLAFHQFLDMMWTSPKVWLFPLLGNFARSPTDPLWQAEHKIAIGATSPEEILLYIALITATMIVIAWKLKKKRKKKNYLDPTLSPHFIVHTEPSY